MSIATKTTSDLVADDVIIGEGDTRITVLSVSAPDKDRLVDVHTLELGLFLAWADRPWTVETKTPAFFDGSIFDVGDGSRPLIRIGGKWHWLQEDGTSYDSIFLSKDEDIQLAIDGGRGTMIYTGGKR